MGNKPGPVGQRVIQTPKVYLNDTGLLSYLLGITIDRIKAEGTLAGETIFLATASVAIGLSRRGILSTITVALLGLGFIPPAIITAQDQSQNAQSALPEIEVASVHRSSPKQFLLNGFDTSSGTSAVVEPDRDPDLARLVDQAQITQCSRVGQFLLLVRSREVYCSRMYARENRKRPILT
jgi:hypothetical protein